MKIPRSLAWRAVLSSPSPVRISPPKATVVPQGRTEHFGHAEMLVAAPVAFVRDQATDFTHYKDFSNGRIRQSRLVDKRAGSTDVYLQVPVLHGMVTLWQVLRFGDVKRSPASSSPATFAPPR